MNLPEQCQPRLYRLPQAPHGSCGVAPEAFTVEPIGREGSSAAVQRRTAAALFGARPAGETGVGALRPQFGRRHAHGPSSCSFHQRNHTHSFRAETRASPRATLLNIDTLTDTVCQALWQAWSRPALASFGIPRTQSFPRKRESSSPTPRFQGLSSGFPLSRE